MAMNWQSWALLSAVFAVSSKPQQKPGNLPLPPYLTPISPYLHRIIVLFNSYLNPIYPHNHPKIRVKSANPLSIVPLYSPDPYNTTTHHHTPLLCCRTPYR
jgi:hypothetical protein